MLEARADDGLVTPGEEVGVAVSLFNSGGSGLEVEELELEALPGWTVARREGEAGSASRRGRSAVALHRGRRP